jgi:flavin reductase (DIM6/NTAB) family NADH-FMN oxidoreductase RutF
VTEGGITAFNVAELKDRDAYKLLTSALVPRPIAWVSTVSRAGVPNLAPYSFFNAVASDPLTVMFSPGKKSDGSPKDSLKNAQETGAFVVNLADETLSEALNHTSGAWAHGVNEFAEAGLGAVPSSLVRPPRVGAAPVALECRVSQLVTVMGSSSTLVLGQVLMVHVRDGLLGPDGLIVAERYRPIARLGRDEYSTLGRVFSLSRPKV